MHFNKQYRVRTYEPSRGRIRRPAIVFLIVVLFGFSGRGLLIAGDLPAGYATGFTLDERDGFVLLEVTRPWPGADISMQYALIERGEDMPEGVPTDATLIRTPVRRVVTTSTTFVAGFELLDSLERIVGHDNPAFLYSEAARERRERGEITSVGTGAGLDLETIVDLEPDLVMVNQYDESDGTVARLGDAGVPALVIGDWTEQSPLGRMEWLYLTGLLTGETGTAEAHIRESIERYNELRARTEDLDERPEVLINGPFQGTWAVPEADAYSARFIEHAGGDYAWSDTSGTGSIFLDIESVFETAGDADIWINPGQWESLADVDDERLFEFAPLVNGEVYNYNRRVSPGGGLDYFESGPIRPDVILEDLISIFHPELLPDHERVYYQRLD